MDRAAQAIDDLMKHLSARFPDQVELPRDGHVVTFSAKPVVAVAPTGEPYVEFAPHVTAEGTERKLFHTVEDVVSAAREEFDAYAALRSGKLYWRIKPEVQFIQGERPGWMFYMRLLISDKPPQTKES